MLHAKRKVRGQLALCIERPYKQGGLDARWRRMHDHTLSLLPVRDSLALGSCLSLAH
jgi:hypothetical protein